MTTITHIRGIVYYTNVHYIHIMHIDMKFSLNSISFSFISVSQICIHTHMYVFITICYFNHIDGFDVKPILDL